MSKAPRIRVEMNLDGKVVDATVLADSLADRDTALVRLRALLPLFEMVSVTPNEHAPAMQEVISSALRF